MFDILKFKVEAKYLVSIQKQLVYLQLNILAQQSDTKQL